MYPPPIKIEADQLPRSAVYVTTLANGERMYSDQGRVYAVQPRKGE